MSENKQVQLELDLGECLDAAKVHAPKKARLPPEEMDKLIHENLVKRLSRIDRKYLDICMLATSLVFQDKSNGLEIVDNLLFDLSGSTDRKAFYQDILNTADTIVCTVSPETAESPEYVIAYRTLELALRALAECPPEERH